MNLKNLLTVGGALIASCATAPEIKKTESDDSQNSQKAKMTTAIMQAVAKDMALQRLLPYEVNPHDGKQPDGSMVICENIDVNTLEKSGFGAVAEGIAANVCANAARVHCTGSPSVTEQQAGDGSADVGDGKVITDCVQETKVGNILGDLKCKTKTGVYNAPDGQCATACTSIEFNK